VTEGTGAPAGGADGAPRVVVLSDDAGAVAGAAAATAVDLARSGLLVTLVRPAAGSLRQESTLTSGDAGDAAVVAQVRVPVAQTVASARRRRQARRRSRLGFAPDPVARRALELRARLRSEEAATRGPSPASPLRSRAAHLGLLRLRALGYAGRRLGDVERAVWQRLDGLAGASGAVAPWRRVLPELDDFELAIGPVLDRLEWDVIHALGPAASRSAAQAVARRLARGGAGSWVYERLPATDGTAGHDASTRRAAAYRSVEREFVGTAAFVVGADRAGLADAYARLVGRPGLSALAGSGESAATARLVETPAPAATGPSVLGIGPANMAGQAWEWARAAERVVPGLRAEVVAVERSSAMVFDADLSVPADLYARDREWAQGLEERVLDSWTHALLEAGRPLFGLGRGRDFTGDAAFLRAAGLSVALVMHGSEIRNPRRHAERSAWSPFSDPGESLTARLQQKWDALHPLVAAFDGPVFVSTPDLLDEVPGAILLPVVVDVEAWASSAPVLERARPVVVHVPSRAALKGSEHVERAMEVLTGEGLVDYRRLDAVPHDEVHRTIREADIVVDQFSIGTYGVLAAESMAGGRLVVSHVPETCREAVGGDLPILEATADTLVEVLRSVLADRDAARAFASRGPAFVRELHDGRRSGAVLRDTLHLHGS
jgi:hypothetical protein